MLTHAIDHVHVEVSDREAAAEWYYRVLGLVRYPKLASWADNPKGPLILATVDGIPTLALFERSPESTTRDTTIAFRTSADEFLMFVADLPELSLISARTGQLLKDKHDVVDHELSWSIYFVDPDGNRLEVTTYEYDRIAVVL